MILTDRLGPDILSAFWTKGQVLHRERAHLKVPGFSVETDSHSYLLHSSSHPSYVKNSIPYSQFLRLRRLCSDDSDFSNKSKEMCQFFKKRGYPASVIQAAHHRAQQIDRQSALQTSQKEKNDRIPFTLTFHPHNNPISSLTISISSINISNIIRYHP